MADIDADPILNIAADFDRRGGDLFLDNIATSMRADRDFVNGPRRVSVAGLPRCYPGSRTVLNNLNAESGKSATPFSVIVPRREGFNC